MSSKKNLVALLQRQYEYYKGSPVGLDALSGFKIEQDVVALQNALALVETSFFTSTFLASVESQCQTVIALGKQHDAGFDIAKHQNPRMALNEVRNPMFFLIRDLLDKLETPA